MSIQRIDASQRMSDAVIHNHTLYYTSVPDDQDLEADIAGQTASALAAIDAILSRVGADRTCLLDVTIFLTDVADFAAMNKVWDEWVPAGSAPVRCTVQAALMDPRYKVELKVVAAV